MAKYKFSPFERWAIFTVHDEKCYIGHEPLDLLTMEVDHIIPESLLADPEELNRVLKQHGLPADFDVNSFANWLPACRRCNNRKRSKVYKPSLLFQDALEQAAARVDEVREKVAAAVSRKAIANALNTLARADLSGLLSDEEKASVAPLWPFQVEHRRAERARQPVQVTPIEVLSDDGFITTVRGPYGVGGGPSGPNVGSAMRCGSCGSPYFNGARCIICGAMDDGD